MQKCPSLHSDVKVDEKVSVSVTDKVKELVTRQLEFSTASLNLYDVLSVDLLASFHSVSLNFFGRN